MPIEFAVYRLLYIALDSIFGLGFPKGHLTINYEESAFTPYFSIIDGSLAWLPHNLIMKRNPEKVKSYQRDMMEPTDKKLLDRVRDAAKRALTPTKVNPR